ncbi:MAG: hypothetical protein A2289_25765 [Deltaproteobacteria bacterium RIFOXYA12_FULL_58_15]|nr:MAG: hypothetical protein A2289_25765 [Deltaproteobacteria bacterium RIFOXYA12_FULL_58_15]OGR11223.1 MAG: hypothetical protein A2341_24905 [Deltaproteobacteria bacterium RIFOXYB12_FULL_58_9]
MKDRDMKIAVVGGGSTYTPELIDGLAKRATELSLTEVSLYDINAPRLQTVGHFSQRMAHAIAPTLDVSLHSSLSDAVRDADFVVTQIRVGGQKARQRDEERGKKHGILGQETTGVGGFAKAMRTIPEILKIAAAIAQHAPRAHLINFTNPVAIVTQALLNHSNVPTIGLCNIPLGFRMDFAKLLGVSPESLEIDSVGLNHLSFIRGVRHCGQDILPRLIREASGEAGKPANLPDLEYPDGFIEALGMIPSGYLRYYFMRRETIAEQAAKEKTRAALVTEVEEELLEYYADPNHVDKPASLEKRGGAFYSHAAFEVIEAIAHDTGAVLTVNIQNGATVRDLPEDACIEVPCKVNKGGAHPLAQRPLEPEIRGMIQHVKAYEELTVRAAMTSSRRDAILALTSHPLMPSVAVAIEIVDEIGPVLGLR